MSVNGVRTVPIGSKENLPAIYRSDGRRTSCRALRVAPAQHDHDVLVARRPVPPGEQRGERGRAARLDDQAERVPQHGLRAQDRLVVDQDDALDVRWAIGNISSPTRRGASESAAMPPAGASTGSPACSARCSVGAASGSTPITRMRPPYHAAMPPISPPPPTATSNVSRSGACSSSSQPERALPQQRLVLIEGVHRQRAGAAAHASLAASASA